MLPVVVAALLVFGSDWPGTNASWYPADPLLGIYATVARQTLDGASQAGWFPAEPVTVQAALEAYTIAPAYAAFQEDWKGTLAPGYAADLAVISQDLFAIPPTEIRDVRMVRTMVDGRWFFRSEVPIP